MIVSPTLTITDGIFTAGANCNAERAKESLRATQSAGGSGMRFWACSIIQCSATVRGWPLEQRIFDHHRAAPTRAPRHSALAAEQDSVWKQMRRRRRQMFMRLWCVLFRVTGLSPYWGLLGAKNWELIQPFKRVFSTWTQSPSRLVAVNRVPLGAVPRTGAFPDGADLMFTPGRCKKTRSGFCSAEVVWGVTALGATWGEASAVSEAGTSGEGTAPDASRAGSGTVGAGCTGFRMTVARLLERISRFLRVR